MGWNSLLRIFGDAARRAARRHAGNAGNAGPPRLATRSKEPS